MSSQQQYYELSSHHSQNMTRSGMSLSPLTQLPYNDGRQHHNDHTNYDTKSQRQHQRNASHNEMEAYTLSPSSPQPISMVENDSKSMKISLPSIKEFDYYNKESSVTQHRMAIVSNKPPIITVEQNSFVRRKNSLSSCSSSSSIEDNSNKRKRSKPNECHSCKSTETPEWRKGPLGPRTLCNACGLIWIKLCKQDHQSINRSSNRNSSNKREQAMPTENNKKKHTLSFLLS